MGPYNKMFAFILAFGSGLLLVLVVALILKWAAGDPNCKADPSPLRCFQESVR